MKRVLVMDVDGGVRKALQSYLDRHLFDDAMKGVPGVQPVREIVEKVRGMRDRAIEALACDDAAAQASVLRESLVYVADTAKLHQSIPHRQQSIHSVYSEARHALLEFDHARVAFNERAWLSIDDTDVSAVSELRQEGGLLGLSGSNDRRDKWQDLLDHVFNNRYYQIRNALREKGWQGRRDEAILSLPKADGIWRFTVQAGFYGHGKNVVALDYRIWRNESTASPDHVPPGALEIRVAESMAMEAADMADYLMRHAGRQFDKSDSLLIQLAADGSVDTGRLERAVQSRDEAYADGFREALATISQDLCALGVGEEVINSALSATVESFNAHVHERDAAYERDHEEEAGMRP